MRAEQDVPVEQCRQVPATGQRGHLVRVHVGALGVPAGEDQKTRPDEVPTAAAVTRGRHLGNGTPRATVSRSAATRTRLAPQRRTDRLRRGGRHQPATIAPARRPSRAESSRVESSRRSP